MKFSLSIPITTVFVLLLTLVINVYGLKLSLEKHFPIYIQSINENLENDINLDTGGLEALLSVNTLDTETQKDYKSAINELSQLSSSLESLSKNPELYIEKNDTQTGTLHKKPSASAFHIPLDKSLQQVYNKSILSIFTDPLDFQKGTPERKFILAILGNFLWINAIWFLFVVVVYIIWVRRIFRPINLVIEAIQDIQYAKKEAIFSYKKNNEFRPLINALNTLQNSLKQQENIRNTFLSDLSHEIRTPITAISCLLEAINDGIMKLDSVNIVTLQNEMNRLIKITGKIMEHENFLSEISQDITKENFPLQEITRSIITQYQGQLQKNQQKIIEHFSTKNILFANKEQYIQILHNIFSNFYKYAGKNTELHCKYKRTKTKTILIFSDNGVGVDEQEISLIREKFFRSDTGRNQNNNELSMGIGFSILDRIIVLHNATMKIEHTKPHGLTIILTFPNYE